MKRIVALLIVFLAAFVLAAAEPVKDNGQVEPEEKVQSAPATGKDSQEEIQRSGSWPRPFVPKEKIGADSVVSFPADI